MWNLKQFIVHRDKVPVDAATGRPIDPHNPANHLTYDEAKQYGGEIGFVLTETDPYVFIDIDNCLQQDNTWSPLAVELCSHFRGAYVEVSRSGRGLHIIGKATTVPEHRCKNPDAGVELYHSQRYVAITRTNAAGSPDYDITELLPVAIGKYFQPRAPVTAANPNGVGTLSDTEVLSKMLANRSPMAAMGYRASPQDLWNAEDTLGRFYPDPRGERPYDASSADAALLAHLAFWTGRNPAQMDRLFRQSGLCREKWLTREDYRNRSIDNAISRCEATYTAPPTTNFKSGAQYMSVQQQLEYFAGCVYVRDAHGVWVPDGGILRPDQFRAQYGGYLFILDSDGMAKPTKNAWEVFTESRAIGFPKVHSTCFRPELPSGQVVEEEGRKLVNTYVPIKTPRAAGDISPFLRHLRYMLPDEDDQAILLAYMAAILQYPGIKFQWCPLLQGCEGNGKSIFIATIAFGIGWRYTHLPNADDLGNKFNAWLNEKLFVGVEEIYVSDRREVIDKLKILITNSKVELQGKGANQFTGDNRANFIMCTNHKDAVLKTENDRRFCVFYTAQQEPSDMAVWAPQYFPKLYDWLRNGGYAMVNDYLRQYKIPDRLNPATECHRAPVTSSTREAISLSAGRIEQEILEVIDEGRCGFSGGWVSTIALDALMERKKFRISRHRRKEILTGFGYVKHPALANGRSPVAIPHEGGKPTLYVRKDSLQFNLKTAREVIEHYTREQRYGGVTMGDAMVMGVR